MIDFRKKLNKEQLKVVYEGDGPCLVLSGPGSGKTRTLVYRTAYLLQKKIPPSRILLLTFTKKAAKEMLSRIYRISSVKEKDVCGGTFHHVGNMLLRRYAERIGYGKNFVILDEDDGRNIIKMIINEKGKEDIPKPAVIQKIISLSVNAEKNIEEVIEKHFPYFREEVIKVVSEIKEIYGERKKKRNLMDYDDLLLKWKEILSFPDIQKEISENFLYVLVDEYQDTNSLQNEIIKKISEAHKNILVVGDDAQSIYSFRAADIENIINFSNHYPGAKVFKLEENYRSSTEILDIANRVIENNEKKLEKKLKSVKGEGVQPTVIPFSNPNEQAVFVADYIEREGDVTDTAVLFRAHFHCVELEIELAKRGIPYALRGGVRFFEQFHIKDVTAFLKIFVNFYDESSWRRLLLRQEGVGEVNAKKIMNILFEKKNIKETIKQKENILQKILTGKKQIKTLLSLLEQGSKENTSGKIKLFLENFYYHYIDFSFENSRERKNDLKKLWELSLKYEDLEKMLTDFSLSEDFQKEEKVKDTVVLSTVHQAKGLEWKNVFVISLREGFFPHSRSIEEDLIEEERRLFYVAVTRCKENLFLTYPLYDFRQRRTTNPSRFLGEAGVLETEITVSDEEIIENEDEWEIF